MLNGLAVQLNMFHVCYGSQVKMATTDIVARLHTFVKKSCEIADFNLVIIFRIKRSQCSPIQAELHCVVCLRLHESEANSKRCPCRSQPLEEWNLSDELMHTVEKSLTFLRKRKKNQNNNEFFQRNCLWKVKNFTIENKHNKLEAKSSKKFRKIPKVLCKYHRGIYWN